MVNLKLPTANLTVIPKQTVGRIFIIESENKIRKKDDNIIHLFKIKDGFLLIYQFYCFALISFLKLNYLYFITNL